MIQSPSAHPPATAPATRTRNTQHSHPAPPTNQHLTTIHVLFPGSESLARLVHFPTSIATTATTSSSAAAVRVMTINPFSLREDAFRPVPPAPPSLKVYWCGTVLLHSRATPSLN